MKEIADAGAAALNRDIVEETASTPRTEINDKSFGSSGVEEETQDQVEKLNIDEINRQITFINTDEDTQSLP